MIYDPKYIGKNCNMSYKSWSDGDHYPTYYTDCIISKNGYDWRFPISEFDYLNDEELSSRRNEVYIKLAAGVDYLVDLLDNTAFKTSAEKGLKKLVGLKDQVKGITPSEELEKIEENMIRIFEENGLTKGDLIKRIEESDNAIKLFKENKEKKVEASGLLKKVKDKVLGFNKAAKLQKRKEQEVEHIDWTQFVKQIEVTK